MFKKDVLEKQVSKMVHDIRTPLTVLNMLHTILQQTYLVKNPQLSQELAILAEETAKIDAILIRYRAELQETLRDA